MRRWTTLGLIMAAALMSLPFNLLAQEQPERTLNVVETIPAANEEIGLTDPIVFYFDAELDCSTTPTLGSATLTGETTCEGTSLVFTPDAPLEVDTVFTLTIDTDLTSVDGAKLAAPFTLTISTRGFLIVTNTAPTDSAQQVDTSSEITVTFNRPVVPLTTLDAQADFPQPLSFDPPLDGHGVWIGTSVYQFIPQTSLAGGTDYVVTVDNLTAVDGATMREPHVFGFATQNPAVLEFIPVAEATDIALSQKIQVTFNQPMDRASTEEAFFLSIQEVPGEIAGSFEWNDTDTGFMFTPEALVLDASYTFGFTPDAALNIVKTQAIAPFGINFYTAHLPAITQTYPEDGDTDAPPYEGIVLSFASKMNPETILDRLIIDPAPDDIDGYFNEYNNQYTALFPLRGDTAYTVQILPGMEDVYGNTIDEGQTFSFTTRSQNPEFSLNVPYNNIGLYDAGRDDTTLYVTHMNVSQIDLALYQVDAAQLTSSLQSQTYYDTVRNIANSSAKSLVKTWAIEGAELRNTRRFDLVDIGAPGAADVPPVDGVPVLSCEGALPSRANIGDRAQIITSPEPTRARSTPVTGDIVELLYRDYAFTITGGPECRDSIVWWQIELRDGQLAWIAEGLNGNYFFEIVDEAANTAISLSSLTLDGGPLPAGVYYLNVSAPEVSEIRQHVMIVSNAALIVKRGASRTVVWTTDFHTGTPLEGVNVQLLQEDMSVLTAVTDSLGVATFDYDHNSNLYSRAVAVVDDGVHFGVTTSDWSDGLYPYEFGIAVDTQPAEYRIYLYTDRPVYRPGQPVHFRGVVRHKQDNNYTLPDFDTLQLRGKNSNYDDFIDQTVTLSEYGTFEGTFTLDEEAPLGYYGLTVTPPTDNIAYSEEGVVNFDVAQYRLPEFQVTVNAEASEVVQGDVIVADIDTTYFFGGPVANADISYYVTRESHAFAYEGSGNYSFNWYNDAAQNSFTLRDYNYQSGTSDAAGLLRVEIPAETSAGQRSLVYTIEAVTSDESGQSVSGRTRVIVHQGDFYIGIAPRDFIGAVGQPLNVDLITVDTQSAVKPATALMYTIYEQRWNSVQGINPYNSSIIWKSELEEVLADEGAILTDTDGKAEISFTPEQGGSYRIIATGTDVRGNVVISEAYVWVAGSEFVAWRQTNTTTIDLVTDKQMYAVGDTAEILIPSPFMGRTEALITIERDGVLRTERLTLESNSTVYRLPIEEDFAPNIYFGITLIKGVDTTNPVTEMRIGYTIINVEKDRFALNIDITPDTELAGPRDTVAYTIRVTDYTGAPVQAELGLALTDLAALSLGTDYSGTILEGFYGLERLGVIMSSGLVLNTDLITQYTRDVIKGGGGGGGGEFGVIELREQFIDTAYWNGQLETDENGIATVSITLPDNLTTWRLNVRGVTKGIDTAMLVGQATDDLVATKPLIVRPIAPRFMTRGDILTLGAVVNNNTFDELTTAVSVQATGVNITGDLTQTVVIPAMGRTRVNWTASVDDTENVALIFSAQAGDYNDATRPAFGQGDDRTLPVYQYEVPEFVGTGGTLRTASARVEAVVLPRRYTVTEGTLTVELEPSLAVTALNAIDALKNFNCECTETTATRLLANIAGLRALEALGDEDDPRIPVLADEAHRALQRLYAQQHVDGGWGWYTAKESDTLVTSWVVIALMEAGADVYVEFNVGVRSIEYLAGQLQVNSRSTDPYSLNRSAIMVYALALSGHKGISASISNLYDLRDRLNIYARALLLDAILIAQPDDTERINTLRDDLLNSAIISANGAHWEEESYDWYNWNSNTRTTAIVMRALLHNNAQEPLLPNAIRWLMIARQADAWETTQETAWSLLALTEWMLETGETQPDFAYTVAVNGVQAVDKTLTPADAATSETVTLSITELNAEAPNPIEITRGEGSGALYYTAYLNAYLPVPEVPAVSNGLSINRTYRTLGGQDTINEAQVGDLVEVTVTLIAPNALHFVLIEDPLPAGLEAINPNLNTSQQTGTAASFQSSAYPDFNWWIADVQYRDEKTILSTDYVPAGTYQFKYVVRATVEGTYNVIPTTGREFYLPEVYGRGEGSLFTVLPADE